MFQCDKTDIETIFNYWKLKRKVIALFTTFQQTFNFVKMHKNQQTVGLYFKYIFNLD